MQLVVFDLHIILVTELFHDWMHKQFCNKNTKWLFEIVNDVRVICLVHELNCFPSCVSQNHYSFWHLKFRYSQRQKQNNATSH